MSRPAAPSMPTETQIREAHKTVAALNPGARIKSVGPNGVEFDYPTGAVGEVDPWAGRPFTAEGA